MAQPTQERIVSELERPEKTPGNVGHAGSGIGPEDDPHYQDHEDDHTHHVSMKTYYIVFALLMVLLFVTVGAWWIDQHYLPLGAFSTPIAMAIAIAKALAIVLIFMHVKFSSNLVKIFASTGVAFVSIMFILTGMDYVSRPLIPIAGQYTPQTSQNSMGNTQETTGKIIRSTSVGSSPNGQSSPADSLVGSAANAPGNATQTGLISGRDSGPRVTNPGVMGADVRIMPDVTGATTAGATSMGGAMNGATGVMSQGGSDQSSGLQGGGNAITQGAEQSGGTGAAGMGAGREDVAKNGSASNPGPIIGGAANNVYGSSVQSAGIEPRVPVTRPAGGATSSAATKPAGAAKPAAGGAQPIKRRSDVKPPSSVPAKTP